MKRIADYAARSEKGDSREKNEDSWYANPEMGLFIIADGMGGHHGGEIASKLVVTRLPELINDGLLHHIDSHTEDETLDKLSMLLKELSTQVFNEGLMETGLHGMGATVVMALIHNGTAYIGHMGDSRLYLYRDNQLAAMTHDHSITQYLIDTGAITKEQARHHESHGRISQYAGMNGDPLPAVTSLTLQNKDRLLMCTDGLTGTVEESSIASLLEKVHELQNGCERLIALANQTNAKDNITVMLVDIN
ncbi:MAG: serine/threonine-protein phosphatase [Gammaproteobacteria bacterium]|nr:MAG: serine/threonine-protein phosphatase [Gammaproteobacteria bacterium]